MAYVITSESDYRDAFTIKKQINAMLDEQVSTPFDSDELSEELEAELSAVCDAIERYEDRVIYANLSACNF